MSHLVACSTRNVGNETAEENRMAKLYTVLVGTPTAYTTNIMRDMQGGS